MHNKLDFEARQDIADLFGRYCHRVDGGDGEGWAALFTDDGIFDVPGAIHLEGHEQLRNMPGIVLQQGAGKWRHQVTNIVAESGDTPDTARVRAYGVLSDWRNSNSNSSGTLVSFSDYHVNLRRLEGEWRIQSLTAIQATELAPTPR
ncbi:MAG TPA: nuclear transport factor 2 family protein [Steroidobacteraceae bacterium]|jgi:uncharacterized protein (TIGR02246 family)|nr:nuclear transport factor 2 family protein [Steroidobacteraceae bacterium]